MDGNYPGSGKCDFFKIHLTHDLHFVILIKKCYQILCLQKVFEVNIEVQIYSIFSLKQAHQYTQ